MNVPGSFGELQLAVLRILWSRGEATVAGIHKALQAERTVAFTTVATVLSRLEKVHGVVAHRSEGRTYVYRALVGEKEVQASMVNEVVAKAFDGDALALVSHLLTSEAVNDEELERVRAMIAASDAGKG